MAKGRGCEVSNGPKVKNRSNSIQRVKRKKKQKMTTLGRILPQMVQNPLSSTVQKHPSCNLR